ncbi:MAG: amylo-alpha-1,6-glucosidase [Nanoarchaeota archaeon]
MKIDLKIQNLSLKLNSGAKGVYLPLGESYLVISNFSSKFFGLNWKEYKILDFNNIFPLKKVKIAGNELIIDNVSLKFEKNKLTISNYIPIFIDLRHLYDINPFNRKYNIKEERKEENKEKEFILNSGILNLRFKGDFKLVNKEKVDHLLKNNIILNYSKDEKGFYWIEREYSFDKRRKDNYKWYVLYLFDFKGKIIFPFEFKDKEKELNNAIKGEIQGIIRKFQNNNLKIAFLLAIRNILDKQVGRPWFFQEWKRDFLVSLDAFYLFDKEFVKDKLMNYFLELLNENNFHTDEKYLLLARLIDFWHLFDEKEKSFIKNKIFNLEFSVPIYNLKGDTWMDSIDREGISIEIQFYAHKFFKFFENEEREFYYLRKSLEKEIKKFLFNDFILDNLNNYEIRPNFLLAWYFNKELFENKFLDYIMNNLKQLLLDWGGLTTISFCYPLHYKVHTGIDSKSYHNGDSWYYLNNIAAYLFLNFYKENRGKSIAKFLKKEALKIINASLNDLFNQFIFGAHSEISSAYKQESLGCFDQLWSNATLIIALKELAELME